MEAGNMWKQKYRELYFNTTYENRDTFGALKLKLENMPNSLFKYTKAKYAIEMLNDDFIKVTNPSNANDPFEGELLFENEKLHPPYKEQMLLDAFAKLEFDLSEEDKMLIINSKEPLPKLFQILYNSGQFFSEDVTPDEFENKLWEVNKNSKRNLVKKFNNNLKEQIVFVSLSEHFDNSLMWSHYADSHKGVCIGYDIRKSEYDFFEEICHPVFYVKDSDFTEDINQIMDDDRNKLKLLEEPFLVKSEMWKDESEWRLLFNKERLEETSKIVDLSNFIKIKEDLSFFKFPKPTCVFLGLKISEEYMEKIKRICIEREIKVYKMVKDDSKYDLSYEEV